MLSFWCITRPSADEANESVPITSQCIEDVYWVLMPRCIDDDVIGIYSLTASAEGRVEH